MCVWSSDVCCSDLKCRFGGSRSASHARAAMPMTASSQNMGRHLAIAGWRRKSVNRPRNASKPPFPPMEERAGMLRAGAALSMVRLFSLILYRHAHDVLIGGQQQIGRAHV